MCLVTWLVLSEIFPAGVRGRAFAFITCFNWAAHLLVTFSFLNVIGTCALFTLPTEMHPPHYKTTLQDYGNIVLGIAPILYLLWFLPVCPEIIGMSGIFLLYGSVAVVSIVFICLMLPETKGKSLQQIDRELSEKRFSICLVYCTVYGIRQSII